MFKTLVDNRIAIIAKHPHLIDELCRLVGGNGKANHFVSRETILWQTLETYDGWQLQRHLCMDSCRVLDASGKCVVFGTEAGVLCALDLLSETYGDVVGRYHVCESLAERMVSDEELEHMKNKSLISELVE